MFIYSSKIICFPYRKSTKYICIDLVNVAYKGIYFWQMLPPVPTNAICLRVDDKYISSCRHAKDGMLYSNSTHMMRLYTFYYIIGRVFDGTFILHAEMQ